MAATTILVVRHAMTAAVGRTLAGWLPGWHLDAEGRVQADRLAARLDSVPIAAVYSSPLERALETAAPIAGRRNLPVVPLEALGEIRFGEWTGRGFETLVRDPAWRRFNEVRSLAGAPGGELLIEAQARAIRALDGLRADHPDQTIVVVSHGDVIRGLVQQLLGMPVDFVYRLQIDPASITEVRLSDGAPVVIRLNVTA